ncbi:MAG: GC-type dockerin domain-anchored protein [Planctomycetota bacterium]
MRLAVFAASAGIGGALVACAPAISQCTPEIVAQVGGGGEDLLLDERGYLYLLGPRLGVVDVREPTRPVLTRINDPYLGGPYFSLGLTGETLIALHGDDFQWALISGFDVSDPVEPTVIFDRILTADSYASASGERFFQLAFGSPALAVWDFTAPVPTARGVFIPLPGECRAIASRGTTAFASTDAGVVVVDGADPAAPEVRSVIPILDEASRSAFDGSLLIVGTQFGPTYTVDVRDIDNPRILGSVDRAAFATAAGPRFAVVIEGESVVVIDTTDPTEPSVAGSLAMTGLRPEFVQVLDGFAFVAASRTTYVIDISGCLPCLADLDGSGGLDIFDFLEFQRLFDAGDIRSDFNRDGASDFADFLAFFNAFGAGC